MPGTKQGIATASSGILRQLACRLATHSAIFTTRHIFSRDVLPLVMKLEILKTDFGRILWQNLTRLTTHWQLTPSWIQPISTNCGGVPITKVGYGSILPQNKSCSSKIGMQVLRNTLPYISWREDCAKTQEWVITISKYLNAWSLDF